MSRKPPPAELVQAIIDAACELRDQNWDEDSSGTFDRLDQAVDAYRAYLRAVRPTKRDLEQMEA